MNDAITQSKVSSFDRPAPEDVVRFLGALFDPRDYVLVRPIESWTEGTRKRSRVVYGRQRWQHATMLGKEGAWQSLLQVAEKEGANLYFGVCPRVGGKGQYDLAWQIRTVRTLWTDIDHCTPAQAFQRVDAAGLPHPSIVVSSGHGAHLYWILEEPFLIDKRRDRPPSSLLFVDQGKDKKKKPVKYIKPKTDEMGVTLCLNNGKTPNPECPWGELSAKAQHTQDVLSGIAGKVGGDRTTDLSRLLRLPGTMNRKDARNGKEPVPCELVECDPERRYPFADFASLAATSPAQIRREAVKKIPLPKPARMTAKRQNRLDSLIIACAAAEPGQRSEADWALCCWAVENGMSGDHLWSQVAGIGKFAEGGLPYFQRTYANAQQHTQERLWDRAKAKSNGKAHHNGYAVPHGTLSAETPHGPDSPDGPDGPDSPDGIDAEGDGGDGDDKQSLVESATDPHRLAREWLRLRSTHSDAGDSLAYYRQQFWRWNRVRWEAAADHEMAATVNHFVRRLLEQEARLGALDAPSGDSEKPNEMPVVTKRLVDDVLAALAGLTLIPQSIEQPVWRGKDNPGPRNWIALHNGILDTDALLAGADRALLPHSPPWFSPSCLPCDFDAAADCPRWRAFLERNLGDDADKQGLLQKWFGYLLLPDTSLQRFLVMTGEGANGKSVICAALTALLGAENVSTEPLELFDDKFRLVNTLGKLANIASEVGELEKAAEGVLKAFVVGDSISFERKFKQAYSARPTARLLLATNNVPHFADKSDGLWRRMLLLPFTVQIPEGERIAGMDRREFWAESGELPGILNWALAGLAALRERQRFVVPTSCQAAADRLRVESNPARRYLLENYQPGAGEIVKADLYAEYREWSTKHGHHSLSEPGFGKEVKRTYKGVRDGRTRASPTTGKREHTYAGITPRTEGEG